MSGVYLFRVHSCTSNHDPGANMGFCLWPAIHKGISFKNRLPIVYLIITGI